MFTSYPNDYDSLFSELRYEYSSQEERDITLFVVNTTSDNILGVKKFYTSDSASINVAPIVRGYCEPDPTTLDVGSTGFVGSMGNITLVLCSDENETSPERTFCYSKGEETEYGLLTTMPTESRPICLDESELLTFRVDPAEAVTIVERQYAYGLEDEVATTTYTLAAQASGFATFNVVATPSEKQLEVLAEKNLVRFELEVSQPSHDIAVINYMVVITPGDNTRLAWISSRGSIEHYSFPVVNTMSHLSDGVCRVSLTSAYESYTIRKAMAEMVESSKVWLCGADGAGYSEVTLQSESLAVTPRSSLATMDVTIDI